MTQRSRGGIRVIEIELAPASEGPSFRLRSNTEGAKDDLRRVRAVYRLRLKAWGVLPPEARRRTVAGLVIQMLDEVLGGEVVYAWDVYRRNPGCSSRDFQDACQQLNACRGIEMTPGKG